MSNVIILNEENNLEKVIVMWAGSTEKMNNIDYKNSEILIESIVNNNPSISPSTIFAVASILSGNIFMNTSPQNTINNAILELAKEYGSYVAGSDLKSGQTKLKSVLVDFLASSSIKPLSIVSYNHNCLDARLPLRGLNPTITCAHFLPNLQPHVIK